MAQAPSIVVVSAEATALVVIRNRSTFDGVLHFALVALVFCLTEL